MKEKKTAEELVALIKNRIGEEKVVRLEVHPDALLWLVAECRNGLSGSTEKIILNPFQNRKLP